MAGFLAGLGSVMGGLGGLLGGLKSPEVPPVIQLLNSSSETRGTSAIEKNELSESLIKELEKLTGGRLDSFGTTEKALTGVIQSASSAPKFDVDSYVNGVMSSATARATGELESNINKTADAAGGSESGNSMVALLGNRLRNDTNASLAGINAEATATGTRLAAETETSRTQNILGASQGLSQDTLGILQLLRGASTTQGQTMHEQTVGKSDSRTNSSDDGMKSWDWADTLEKAFGNSGEMKRVRDK